MASRRRAWADRRFAGVSLVANTELIEDLLEDLGSTDTLTVVRIVGDLIVNYLVSTTVGDALSIVDLGIGVASSAAFAVGGATPAPTSQTEYPPRGWIYVASQPVTQILDAAGGVSIVDRPARFQFDIRAMRKIDKGVLFMNLVQNNITVGGAMQVTGRIRSLVLV